MKPPTCKRRRLIARIKPGGFLRLPLPFLRHSGWQSGDVLLCEVVDGYLRICKPPTETAWRIERLRKRLAQASIRRMIRDESVPAAIDSSADEQLLDGMIGQMIKTTVRASAAVDAALASVAASDPRIASMERSAQYRLAQRARLNPNTLRRINAIKGPVLC